MPQVLFCGGKLNSVNTAGGTADSTTAGTFDTGYCDASLKCTTGTDSWNQTFRDINGANTTVITGQTLFAHFESYSLYTVNSARTVVSLKDGSGYEWLALRTTNNFEYGVYGNTGTGPAPVWTQIGPTVYAYGNTTRLIIDIKIKLGSPHLVEFSVNGSLVSSGSFTQASLVSLASIFGTTNRVGDPTYYSQIMVTEGISTINGKVPYKSATSAGANSGMTGSAADINEAANSDATTLSAATAGLKSTFAMGDATVPAGYVIKGVWNWARAKNDGVSPANLKGVTRSGGADYASANMAGIGTSFGALLDRRDTDPATDLPWTQAGWNAAEQGFEAAA